METENKQFEADFDVKETGEITGTAWPYGSADRIGDVIQKGAFGNVPKSLPMLFQHDQSQTVGVWHSITETDQGIKVKGTLFIDEVARAREVHALVKGKAITGLSVGFQTKSAQPRSGGGRSIKQADLLETSLVAIPMNPGARIETVKSSKHIEGNFEMENDELNEAPNVTEGAANTDTQITELKSALADTLKAFESLKTEHETLATKLNRPNVQTKAADPAEADRKAFKRWINGDEKALTITGDSGTQGGVLAPEEFEATLVRKVVELNPFRQFAGTMTIGAGSVEIPVQGGNLAVGWVSENQARSETDTTFTNKTITVYDLGAYVDVSNNLLADSQVDIMAFVADEFAKVTAKTEAQAFVSGDGSGKPTGITGNGSIGTVDAAATTAFTVNEIVDLVHSLPIDYSRNGALYMNRTTIATLRKLALASAPDAWGDSLAAGNPPTFLGYPVREVPDMVDAAASAVPIIFGDLASAYRIVDRSGMTLLRDPYTQAATNKTRVHVNRRVGGDVLDTAAVTFLQMAAS